MTLFITGLARNTLKSNLLDRCQESEETTHCGAAAMLTCWSRLSRAGWCHVSFVRRWSADVAVCCVHVFRKTASSPGKFALWAFYGVHFFPRPDCRQQSAEVRERDYHENQNHLNRRKRVDTMQAPSASTENTGENPSPPKCHIIASAVVAKYV